MRKKNLVRPHIFYTLWLKFSVSRNIFLFIVMNIFLCFKNYYFLVSSCILSFIFMTVLKRNELSSKQKPCFLFLSLVVAWLVFKQSSFYRHIQKEISSCLFLFLFSFLEPHKLTCKLTSPHSILSGKFYKLLYVLDHHLLDLKKNCCCKLEHFFFIECIDFFFLQSK